MNARVAKAAGQMPCFHASSIRGKASLDLVAQDQAEVDPLSPILGALKVKRRPRRARGARQVDHTIDLIAGTGDIAYVEEGVSQGRGQVVRETIGHLQAPLWDHGKDVAPVKACVARLG